MKLLTIKAYEYHELETHAKLEVLYWLDEDPLEFENYEGKTAVIKFSDMTTKDLLAHCKMNGYLFDYRGNPVHHLYEEG